MLQGPWFRIGLFDANSD